mgnify:CR=1 FL=1
MFTLEQIQQAHKKVKSGADFPAYAQELTDMGVTGYDTFVSDGHAEYFGNVEVLSAPPKYTTLIISELTDKDYFIERLKLHQQGGTDYTTFCKDCAQSGIHKWTLDMQKKTCTYYDLS